MNMRIKSLSIAFAGLFVAACGSTNQHARPDITPPPPTPGNIALVATANEDGTITVADNGRRSLIRTIHTGGAAKEIVRAEDGRHVFVAVQAMDNDFARILKIDARSGSEVGKMDIGKGYKFADMALMPDKIHLAVLMEQPAQVLLINTEAGNFVGKLELTDQTLRGLAVISDSRLAVTTGNEVQLLDIVENNIGIAETVYLDGPTLSLKAYSDNSRLLVTVIKPAQLVDIDLGSKEKTVYALEEAEGPAGIDITPDGSTAVVVDAGILDKTMGASIYKINLDSGEIGSYSSIAQGPRNIVIDGNGIRWIANRSSSSLIVFDAADEFATEMPTGHHPEDITKVSSEKID